VPEFAGFLIFTPHLAQHHPQLQHRHPPPARGNPGPPWPRRAPLEPAAGCTVRGRASVPKGLARRGTMRGPARGASTLRPRCLDPLPRAQVLKRQPLPTPNFSAGVPPPPGRSPGPARLGPAPGLPVRGCASIPKHLAARTATARAPALELVHSVLPVRAPVPPLPRARKYKGRRCNFSPSPGVGSGGNPSPHAAQRIERAARARRAAMAPRTTLSPLALAYNLSVFAARPGMTRLGLTRAHKYQERAPPQLQPHPHPHRLGGPPPAAGPPRRPAD
jgi:hypothetical protein